MKEIGIETLSYTQVAKMIDHSLLRPELTVDEVIAGCELARRYEVASVPSVSIWMRHLPP
jgi:deoxyribose-phosphate aldolase